MATIGWLDLLWCLVPVVLVLGIYVKWHGQPSELVIATTRMVVQLLAVGYVLIAIFTTPSPALSLLIVSAMMIVAAWIAIRPVKQYKGVFLPALLSLGFAVLLHLFITIIFVLNAESWFQPQLLIPLAGMYFANTMNAISIATERYHSELENGKATEQAKISAFHAAMIPQVNSLLAVGLVALPGMMTGQILSGVSPLVAVRYQIMIMTMILGTSGVGCSLMLHLLNRKN